MHEIKLNHHSWQIDYSKRLGSPGGFGEVFCGYGAKGEVAIKRLKINAEEAAHRELSISEDLFSGSATNVVPVYDYGQDANSDRYFIVMPKCESDLYEYLRANYPIPQTQLIEIVTDIVAGMKSTEKIVHRDLKPQNILYHNGNWCLADFGISKFVQDSTSIETLRRCLSPPYAAPEQWRGDRPTKATDVYALGAIIYTILEGHPPFQGSLDDLQEFHQLVSPPPPTNGPPRLKSLVTSMLRKSIISRPTLGRIQEIISSIEESGEEKYNLLTEVDHKISQHLAIEEQVELERQKRQREYEELAEVGEHILGEIYKSISTKFLSLSQNSNKSNGLISLGFGELLIGSPSRVGFDAYEHTESSSHRDWTIVSHSGVRITNSAARPPAGIISSSGKYPYTWSSTLFFGRNKVESDFRWYEVGFFSISRDTRHDPPFSLSPDQEDFHRAIGKIMHSIATAYGPLPIDAESADAFESRIISLFSDAAAGTLNRPTRFPISPSFWKN